ncbi:MAG: peptidoglycan DD-metalloendopeptidase family protein [Deltaproteobacteria bacterium]|nr:peptidoglycan DD-metalloendopeptidase family protein [Deltaproteobacteria bacterium]
MGLLQRPLIFGMPGIKLTGASRISSGFFWAGYIFFFSSLFPGKLLAATSLEHQTKQGASPEEVAISPNTIASPNLAQALAPLDVFESFRYLVHKAKPGETLARLFDRFGLPANEKQSWLRSVQKHHPFKRLRGGQEIHFYFFKPNPVPRDPSRKEHLKALEIELDDDWNLTWEKGNNGIVFNKREKPFDVELKTVRGVVENSFFHDGARAGLNRTVMSQLVDIFGWEIDFEKAIQKGDTFKLLYEQRSRRGRATKTSFRILAAELINAGKEYFAIYFEKDKGGGRYYDLDGRSLARSFLRFPLEFSSISSQFSHSRFHPILKVDLPHNGVDFAAKRGTPVRAIGDGTVVYSGWRRGGYGRLVEIQHDSVYFSRYAHLQALAPSLKKGAAVKKGQLIGFVGSTGRSTGPHLHFELYQDQQYVDPLTFEIPPEDRIEPFLRRVFENSKRVLLTELGSAPRS